MPSTFLDTLLYVFNKYADSFEDSYRVVLSSQDADKYLSALLHFIFIGRLHVLQKRITISF